MKTANTPRKRRSGSYVPPTQNTFQLITARWHELTPQEQAAWSAAAPLLPRWNTDGAHKRPLTGFMAFQSMARAGAALRQAPPPAPTLSDLPPNLPAVTLSATPNRLTLTSEGLACAVQVYATAAYVNAGRRLFPKDFRLLATLPSLPSGDCDLLPDFLRTYRAGLRAGCVVTLKVSALSQSGFRGQPRPFTVNIEAA